MDRGSGEASQSVATGSPDRQVRAYDHRAPGIDRDVRARRSMRPNRQLTEPQPAPQARRRRRRSIASSEQSLATRLATLFVVAAIIAGALWLDRGQFAAAPPSGMAPQPGETILPTPGGVLVPGEMAPNFVLRTPDNEPVELGAQRGMVVVLQFWAIWCIECRGDTPALNGLDEQAGVTVLGIASGDTPARVAVAARDLHISYRVLVDQTGDVAKAYGASTPPVTIVIDRRGTIASIFVGAADPTALQEAVDAART